MVAMVVQELPLITDMAEQMAQPEVATEVASELEGDLPLDIFPDVAPLETRLRTTQSSETSGEFAEIKERAARTGRNPKTGEKVAIPASKYVACAAGSTLKEKVNG